MQILEGEDHFSEIELGFLFSKPAFLEVEKHLSSWVKLEQKVQVLEGLKRSEKFDSIGETVNNFGHNLFLT